MTYAEAFRALQLDSSEWLYDSALECFDHHICGELTGISFPHALLSQEDKLVAFVSAFREWRKTIAPPSVGKHVHAVLLTNAEGAVRYEIREKPEPKGLVQWSKEK